MCAGMLDEIYLQTSRTMAMHGASKPERTWSRQKHKLIPLSSSSQATIKVRNARSFFLLLLDFLIYNDYRARWRSMPALEAQSTRTLFSIFSARNPVFYSLSRRSCNVSSSRLRAIVAHWHCSGLRGCEAGSQRNFAPTSVTKFEYNPEQIYCDLLEDTRL